MKSTKNKILSDDFNAARQQIRDYHQEIKKLRLAVKEAYYEGYAKGRADEIRKQEIREIGSL